MKKLRALSVMSRWGRRTEDDWRDVLIVRFVMYFWLDIDIPNCTI